MKVVLRDAGGLGDILRICWLVEEMSRTDFIVFVLPLQYVSIARSFIRIREHVRLIAIKPPAPHRSPLSPPFTTWAQVRQHFGDSIFVSPTYPDDPDDRTPVVDLFCPALRHEVETRGQMTMDRLECWAQAAGVTAHGMDLPHLYVSDALAGAMKWTHDLGLVPSGLAPEAGKWQNMKGLIAISAASAASIRTWRNGVTRHGRLGRVSLLCAMLRMAGFTVVMFSDKPVDAAAEHHSITPDIQMQLARLALCEAFIGPDSGFLHLASMIGLPVIGLFGPTRGSLVLKHYRNKKIILQGEWTDRTRKTIGCSRPCYQLPSAGWNAGKCRARCSVLEGISEGDVLAAVSSLWPKPMPVSIVR